jgi:hypothetical protein
LIRRFLSFSHRKTVGEEIMDLVFLALSALVFALAIGLAVAAHKLEDKQ